MSDDIVSLLYDGAVAVREGRLADAQGLLMKVIENDEQNELAWLWLSGAVDDPADQQVALENVLAINPDNAAARQGLTWLKSRYGDMAAPSTSEWTPPPPRNVDEVDELQCYQCGAAVYSVATFCWQCHAPIHCCNNCVFRPVSRCKELQGLTSTMAQAGRNDCEWWRVTN
ncbi:MAG TPA: tetratricopeptide repeat protein [Roseiflexaceae bacterium]|nr:tetratricopeptide repeat protein [Roseiflexaceae bacterium]